MVSDKLQFLVMAAEDVNEESGASQVTIEKVKVAAIQCPSVLGDIEANIKRFSKEIRVASKNGAKIIVLPEASLTGYASQDFKQSWCLPNRCDAKYFNKNRFEPIDPSNVAPTKELNSNQILQHFCKLCKELKIYLTVPYIEKCKNDKSNSDKDNDSKEEKKNEKNVKNVKETGFPWNEYLYFNSVSLIDPNGEIVGHYRKTNLWPAYDNAYATVANDIVTVDTIYGKIGLGICFDVHKILPEYDQENIWCLLYSIAWFAGYNVYNDEVMFRWFNMILPERLKKLGIKYYIVGANWSVDSAPSVQSNDDTNKLGDKIKSIKKSGYDWLGYGWSTIYGPNGIILKQSKKLYDVDILYYDIPLSK